VKRSEINALIRSASACFVAHGWTLPPEPRWDVTDFGLRDWRAFGLVLVNLAEEPEYCEKLMYAQRSMATPAHCHRKKKEDIIARWGTLAVQVWSGPPKGQSAGSVSLQVDGKVGTFRDGEMIILTAGSRVTLTPGVYHEFKPTSEECIIGEVSTANDDLHDNIFENTEVGRFPDLVEDVPPLVRLVSDK
jgi:D-lyxose ketol-isomerase